MKFLAPASSTTAYTVYFFLTYLHVFAWLKGHEWQDSWPTGACRNKWCCFEVSRNQGENIAMLQRNCTFRHLIRNIHVRWLGLPNLDDFIRLDSSTCFTCCGNEGGGTAFGPERQHHCSHCQVSWSHIAQFMPLFRKVSSKIFILKRHEFRTRGTWPNTFSFQWLQSFCTNVAKWTSWDLWIHGFLQHLNIF